MDESPCQAIVFQQPTHAALRILEQQLQLISQQFYTQVPPTFQSKEVRCDSADKVTHEANMITVWPV